VEQYCVEIERVGFDHAVMEDLTDGSISVGSLSASTISPIKIAQNNSPIHTFFVVRLRTEKYAVTSTFYGRQPGEKSHWSGEARRSFAIPR
jgi:hypothetical protein